MFGYDDIYEEDDEFQEQEQKAFKKLNDAIKKPTIAAPAEKADVGEYYGEYLNGITQCQCREHFEEQQKCQGFLAHSVEDKCLYLLDGKQCLNLEVKDFLRAKRGK